MDTLHNKDVPKLIKDIKTYRLFSLLGGSMNTVFVAVQMSGLADKLPIYMQNILLDLLIAFVVFFVFYLVKYGKKRQAMMSHPLYKEALNSVEMKIANEQTDLLIVPNMVASIFTLVLIFSKGNHSNLPILLYIALFVAVLNIGYWLLSLAQRASKQFLNDELSVLKSKDSGYSGYHMGLILLVALLLTFLWMPDAKSLIIKYFAGYEIEVAISISIFALLIGGLLGRFVTWDKYR